MPTVFEAVFKNGVPDLKETNEILAKIEHVSVDNIINTTFDDHIVATKMIGIKWKQELPFLEKVNIVNNEEFIDPL